MSDANDLNNSKYCNYEKIAGHKTVMNIIALVLMGEQWCPSNGTAADICRQVGIQKQNKIVMR